MFAHFGNIDQIEITATGTEFYCICNYCKYDLINVSLVTFQIFPNKVFWSSSPLGAVLIFSLSCTLAISIGTLHRTFSVDTIEEDKMNHFITQGVYLHASFGNSVLSVINMGYK